MDNQKKGSWLSVKGHKPLDLGYMLIRFILSGYIFQFRRARKMTKRENNFVPSEETFPQTKIAVYTVCTGNYDALKEPLYVDDTLDYYAFTDCEIPESSVWKRMDKGVNDSIQTPLEWARYVKLSPHKYFADYDYSIFIDGNIQIKKDIKPLLYTMIANQKTMAIHKHYARDCAYDEGRAVWALRNVNPCVIRRQLSNYRAEGFPKHFGLFETNVMIRKHNDEKCKQIMETWWGELAKFTKRDQLSFTYCLWKNGETCDYVMPLGDNSRNSPYFLVSNHN